MKLDELRNRLLELTVDGDPEVDHKQADDLLLAYINDPEVTVIFRRIRKWYA